jgi:hypothetical protein
MSSVVAAIRGRTLSVPRASVSGLYSRCCRMRKFEFHLLHVSAFMRLSRGCRRCGCDDVLSTLVLDIAAVLRDFFLGVGVGSTWSANTLDRENCYLIARELKVGRVGTVAAYWLSRSHGRVLTETTGFAGAAEQSTTVDAASMSTKTRRTSSRCAA